MSPLLCAVDAVTIPLQSVDAGLAFYRDVLGQGLIWQNDGSLPARQAGDRHRFGGSRSGR